MPTLDGYSGEVILISYNISEFPNLEQKENGMNNGMMENFFGLLKTEMFYDQEDNYKTIYELIFSNE